MILNWTCTLGKISVTAYDNEFCNVVFHCVVCTIFVDYNFLFHAPTVLSISHWCCHVMKVFFTFRADWLYFSNSFLFVLFKACLQPSCPQVNSPKTQKRIEILLEILWTGKIIIIHYVPASWTLSDKWFCYSAVRVKGSPLNGLSSWPSLSKFVKSQISDLKLLSTLSGDQGISA